MYILVAAATYNEINTTIDWLNDREGMVNGHEIEVLITGVGSAATTYALTRQFMWRSPEVVIQAGIGGSFKKEFAPETLAFVDEEVFADLGVAEDDGFVDIFDLGLAGLNEEPFKNRKLVNQHLALWKHFDLPFVRGATINCISSRQEQVDRIVKKYDPVVESMEGAALHYTCILENVPFVQLRAISNFVGERDKKNWKMKEAIDLLNKKLRQIIFEL